MKKAMIGLTAALLMAATASADIAVVGTQTGNVGPTAGGVFSVSYQVQNPNDVLVFGFYGDGGGGALTSLNFDTQPADGLITLDRSSLGYFLNPSTSPSLSVSGTFGLADSSSAGYFLWELSGVDLSGSVQSASGANNTTQITTTSANSFIIDMLGVNDFGISSIAPTSLATQTPDGTGNATYGTGTFVVPGGGYIVPSEATAASTGTYQLGWDVSGGYGNYGELAYAFVAIPEPATLGLVGIFGAGVLFVRRRFMI